MRISKGLYASGVSLAIALLAAMPSAAQTTATTDMSGMMVCAPVKPGDKTVAMMGTTALVCKPFAILLMHKDGTSMRVGNPTAANPVPCSDPQGLTVQQQDLAMRACLNKVYSVLHTN